VEAALTLTDSDADADADSDAGLPVALAVGMGMVAMGASEVRGATPKRAAQSVRLNPLGQHHVPSALSVQ